MTRTLAHAFFTSALGVTALLLANSAAHADETFPVDHRDPIVIQILDGVTGQPLTHVHVQLLGGYDENDLDRRIWVEELLTDEKGQVRLSNQLENLPFLRVHVLKAALCDKVADRFSVERIRRDGLSAANRCGIATVENTPGVFAIFVKGKRAARAAHDAETEVRRKTHSEAANAAAPQAQPAAEPQPELHEAVPDTAPKISVLDIGVRLASFVR